MTLRDDLVFFIYLYQRYLYPVDKKRANEFGRAYEEDEDDEATSSEQTRRLAQKPMQEDNENHVYNPADVGDTRGGKTPEASTQEKKQQ